MEILTIKEYAFHVKQIYRRDDKNGGEQYEESIKKVSVCRSNLPVHGTDNGSGACEGSR